MALDWDVVSEQPIKAGASQTPGDFPQIIRAAEASPEGAISPKGAEGPYQVLPTTIANPGFGVRPASDDSPEERDRVGIDYAKAMLGRYGSPALAGAAYNAGPGQLDQWLAQYGDPRKGQISEPDFIKQIPFPETNAYVQRVAAMAGTQSDPWAVVQQQPVQPDDAHDPWAVVQQQPDPAKQGFAGTVGANIKEFFKQLTPGVTGLFTSAVQGAVPYGEEGAYLNQSYQQAIQNWPALTPYERNKVRQKAQTELPSDQNFALQTVFEKLDHKVPAEKAIAGTTLRGAPFRLTKTQDQPLYQGADALQKRIEEAPWFKPAEGYEQSPGAQLGQATGSMLGGIGATIATGGAALPATLFYFSQAGQQVQDAIQKGATEGQITEAAALGGINGLSDSLPIEILLGHIPVPGIGFIKVPPGMLGSALRVVGKIGMQAFAEGFQEGGQQFLQNVIAKETYNPQQDLTEQVLPNYAAGAGAGSIAEAAALGLEGAFGRRRGRARKTTRPSAEPQGQPSSGKTTAEEGGVEMPPTEAPGASGEGIAPVAQAPPVLKEAPPARQTTEKPGRNWQPLYDEDNNQTGWKNAKSGEERPFEPEERAEPAPANAAEAKPTEKRPAPDADAAITFADMYPGYKWGAVSERERQDFFRGWEDQKAGRPAPEGPLQGNDYATGYEKRRYAEANGKLEPAATREPEAPPAEEAKSEVLALPSAWDQTIFKARRAAQILGIPSGGKKLGELVPEINAALDARAKAGTREAPIVEPNNHEDIEPARENVDLEPSEAQKEAGNYQKGHVQLHGLGITIESPRGEERRGPEDENGVPAWTNTHPDADYGYIKRTIGADATPGQAKGQKEKLDVYIGRNPQSQKAFVIDQYKPNGDFDEHKAILGADTADEALKIYDDGFSDGSGPSRRSQGGLEMSVENFKNWLKHGDTTKAILPQAVEPGQEERNVARETEVARDTLQPVQEAEGQGEGTPVQEVPHGEHEGVAGETAEDTEAQQHEEPPLEAPPKKPTEPVDLGAVKSFRDRMLRTDRGSKGAVTYDLLSEAEKDGLPWYTVERIENEEGKTIGGARTEYQAAQQAAADAFPGFEHESVDELRREMAANAERRRELETRPRKRPDDETTLKALALRDKEIERAIMNALHGDLFTAKKPGTALASKLFIHMEGRQFPVDSLKDASEKFWATIQKMGVGASNTPQALIRDGSGNLIGHIAYNGRVFPGMPQDWKHGVKPLYDPIPPTERTKLPTNRRAPMPKMQDVGEAMAGKRAQAKTSVAKAKDLEAVLAQTREATAFQGRLADGATTGAQKWAGDIQRAFHSFLEEEGQRRGGGRGKWRQPFSKAVESAWEDDPQALRDRAAEYMGKMEILGDALAGAKSVADIHKALTGLLIKSVERGEGTYAKYITNKTYTDYADTLRSVMRSHQFPWHWALGEDELRAYKDSDKAPTKATPLIRPGLPVEDIVRRELPERRPKDKNVSAEDFRKAFGFRGVEFGNWVTGREGQIHLNAAYDALMDLAEAMNMPIKAVSLGGRLGLAFGSRGRGRHAAHYEPSSEVINLTKTRGDGTVAHEWGHALDYFLRRETDKLGSRIAEIDKTIQQLAQDRVSEKISLDELSAAIKPLNQEKAKLRQSVDRSGDFLKSINATLQLTWDLDSALRQLDMLLLGRSHIRGRKSMGPVETAREFVRYLWSQPGWGARRNTQFMKNATALDKGGEKGGYWSRPEELWARSWEAFIFDELAKKGAESPYLVNDWVQEGKVTKDAGYRGTPYPAEDERANFAQMWRALMKQLEWNEDGTLKAKAYEPLPDSRKAVEEALQKIDIEQRWAELQKEKRGAGEPGRLPADGGEPPQAPSAEGVRAPEGERGIEPEGVGPRELNSELGEQPNPASEPGRAPGAEDSKGEGGEGDGGVRRPAGVPTPGRDEREGNRGQRRLRGLNFRIPEGTNYALGSVRNKIENNIRAIKLVNELEKSGALPTAGEQQVLAKYVGWGGIPQIFDPKNQKFFTDRATLQSLLSDKQWAAARASTINAHYTSPDVVRGIWDAMARFDFGAEGSVLEPGMGIGNFLGMRPAESEPHFTGVELDDITGKIARALYPEARVLVQGFETAPTTPNSFDAVVGNAPFANIKPYDKVYNPKGSLSLHNYFIAKSLRMLKPGGVMGVVTTHYTMDALDSSARKNFHDVADLIGAIRLPNTAFKANAGTEVTTDILFFRRRKQGEKPQDNHWLKTSPLEIGKETAPVNNYFVKNPKTVLGEHAMSGTMYAGKTEYTVEGSSDNLKSQIMDASEHIRSDLSKLRYDADPNGQANFKGDGNTDEFGAAPEHIKENAYFEKGGKLFQKVQGVAVPTEMSDVDTQKVKALIPLRDTTREVLGAQRQEWDGEGVAPWVEPQKKLTKLYDAFVKKFGFINQVQITKRTMPDGEVREYRRYPNTRPMRDDPDVFLVSALEKFDEESNKGIKAPIFSQRVVEPVKEITHVETAQEALIASLNLKGRVDIPYMAKILGKGPKEIIPELGDRIFKRPDGAYELAESYLSGNVRAKLAVAKDAAKKNPDLEANIKALEAVQPADLKPADIKVRLGTPWIPNSDVEDFVSDLLETPAVVSFVPSEAVWNVRLADERTVANRSVWGVRGATALHLIMDALNQRPTQISIKLPDGSIVKDQNATIVALARQQDIKDRFARWIWEDEARAKRLSRFYNDNFNNLRPFSANGDHLTLPGSSNTIKLRSTQLKAVWRYLVAGNTLLDHIVGAGKTFSAIASGMEAKRIGLNKKPVFSVPNHMLEQFSREFLQLYPNANILVADEDAFAGDNRRRFVARAAVGNWDAIIMTHSSFERVGMSPEYQANYIRNEIAEYEDMLRDAKAKTKDAKDPTVKELEKAKKRREAKLHALIEAKEKDKGVSFEEMGADSLFVDEAHLFKNLEYMTKNRGMSGSSSQRAFDLYMKSKYIDGLSPGRGVMFMTGTPISNTMAEMFTMQRYLGPRALAERGLTHFDAWAQQFGDIVTKPEVSPTGAVRMKARFATFRNIPELVAMYRQFADPVTKQDLLDTGVIKLPTVKGGKMQTVEVPMNEPLRRYIQELAARSEAVQAGKVDPTEDNHLKISMDGRKAALDMRLVEPTAKPDKDRKSVYVAQNAAKIYHDTAKERGTQLIFLDLSVPREEGYSAYHDIRSELIKGGVKANEIAFIHDADTDDKKAKLFADVRSGRKRIMMGSTDKMGMGTNVQDRLVWIHHADSPWRPADIEQRNGRGERQGNLNDEIGITNYVTVGSFDAYMWQTLERKARFIGQVKQGDPSVREAEDVDDNSLSYAEIKALASGNPLIFQKVRIDSEVDKLQRLENAHRDAQMNMRWQLNSMPGEIKRLAERIKEFKEFQADFEKHKDDIPQIADKSFKTRAEANKAMVEHIEKVKTAVAAELDALKKTRLENRRSFPLGKLYGFNADILSNGAYYDIAVRGVGDVEFDPKSPSGALTRVEGALREIPNRIVGYEEDIDKAKKTQESLKAQVGQPFEKAKELEERLKAQRDIDIQLGLIEPDLSPEATAKIAKIDDRIAELAQGYADGKVEAADYQKQMADLQKKRMDIKRGLVAEERAKPIAFIPPPLDEMEVNQPGRVVTLGKAMQAAASYMKIKPNEETVGIGADLKRMIDLFGPKMYGADMPDVTAKELLQNSFDAIKAAYGRGDILPGKGLITITFDTEKKTLAFDDNGAGMSPEVVKSAFLTIAGTSKDDLTTAERSGGFGLAKLAFIFGNDGLKLKTVRDGIETTLDTNSKELLDGKANLVTRVVSSETKPGTHVEVKFPKTVKNNKGETVAPSLPWSARGFGILSKPLIGDVQVDAVTLSSGNKPEVTTLPIGRNQVLGDTKKVSSAHFPWGDVDVYMGPELQYSGDHRILSSGLYQYSVSIPRELLGWNGLPYDIILDVKPTVEASDAQYPFNNQRENWSPKVIGDVGQLYSFFQRRYAADQARKTGGTFARVQEMPTTTLGGWTKPKSPYEFADVGLTQFLPEAKGFDMPAQIYIKDGKTLIGGKAVDSTASLREDAKLKLENFQFDPAVVPDDLPYFHSNLNVDIVAEAEKAEGVKQASARYFLSRIGTLVQDFRDQLARLPGGYSVWGTAGHPVGISLDKDYHGVHVRVPYDGFFLNPLAVNPELTLDEAIAASWLHTLFHEAAHTFEPNHSEAFTAALAKLDGQFSQTHPGAKHRLELALTDAVKSHRAAFDGLRKVFNAQSTKNVAASGGVEQRVEEPGEPSGVPGRALSRREAERGEPGIRGRDTEGAEPSNQGHSVQGSDEGVVEEPRLQRPAPVFYSALENEIANAKQAKASASQWQAFIRNASARGVKEDEVDWSGVKGWLASNGDKPVTRDDLLAFVRANNIQIKEVLKGGRNREGPEEEIAGGEMQHARYRELEARDVAGEELTPSERSMYDWLDHHPDATDNEYLIRDYDLWRRDNKLPQIDYDLMLSELEELRTRGKRTGPEIDAQIAWLKDYSERYDRMRQAESEEINGGTQYGSYTLPGGENYRELLLTLPSKRLSFDEFMKRRYPQMTEADRASPEAKRLHMPEYERFNGDPAAFHSGHFDEPNVIAHVRFNDRTDAEGKKTLFVEEIQSDFGQQLRRQRQAIRTAVDNDFQGIVERMKKAGVLKEDCD